MMLIFHRVKAYVIQHTYLIEEKKAELESYKYF